MKSQSQPIKTSSKGNQRQQRKPQLFSLWEGWPSEKNCRKLKADENESVMTDSNGSLSVDNTRGSAFRQ